MNPAHNTIYRKIIVAAILTATIAILITAIYGAGLKYQFFFDDFNSLMNDQGIISPQLKTAKPLIESLIKQPLHPNRNLTWLSFIASYKFSGMNPAGFRIVNLALHGLCTIILYLLLKLLWFRHCSPKASEPAIICTPALAGALLFLCHPLALNTVFYISQRFGALATLFYLLGFFAWLKAYQKPQKEVDKKNFSIFWLTITTSTFWAAIHSKEMAMTLPATILFYEFYTAEINNSSVRKHKYIMGSVLAVVVILLFLFSAWQIGLFNQNWINIGFRSKRLWSPGIHLLSEARAFFHYWKLILLPLPGSLSLHHEFQPSPNYFDPAAYTAILGHIIILISAWKLRRKSPLTGFGIFWFYLVLGPPYLFLPQKELLVEYKTYLATPAMAMILTSILSIISNFSEKQKRSSLLCIAYIATGCWLIFLATVTCQRRQTFQNPIAIWSDVLEKYPNSCRALNNRAVEWLKKGSPQNSLRDLNSIVTTHPGYARGLENRGRLRLHLQDYNGAIKDFNQTLALLPNEPELQASRQNIIKLKHFAQRAKIKAAKQKATFLRQKEER